MENSNITNPLDEVRVNKGLDQLNSFFKGVASKDKKEAINLINDKSLHFPTLFFLTPQIYDLKLTDNLNERNKIALEFADEISSRNKKGTLTKYILSDYTQITYSILKWIFETGYLYDGIDDEYDEILDITSILLTKMYRDSSILPIIVNMIFDRHKKGFFTHDLVWAFFECRDPFSLNLIAKQLLSSEDEDAELASKLLSFIPNIRKSKSNRKKQYIAFLKWIEENGLFLYFTGQSLQQLNKPIPYVIVLEAKYLHKYVSINNGNPLKPLTMDEDLLLNEFKELDIDSKILLSSFSNMMYNKDINWWSTWIHKPIETQIRIAKTMIGGEL